MREREMNRLGIGDICVGKTRMRTNKMVSFICLLKCFNLFKKLLACADERGPLCCWWTRVFDSNPSRYRFWSLVHGFRPGPAIHSRSRYMLVCLIES